MAIVDGLVNVGLSFGAILGIFQSNPAACKFAELQRENPLRAISYLRHTWENAVKWTTAHASEGRKRAFQAVLWVDSRPWPGRTGTTDQAVFKTHAEIGFQVGRETYQLSARELAERAGIGLVHLG